MSRCAKRQDVGFVLKQVDVAGWFEGYASVFDVVDSQKDQIVRGAFEQSIFGRESEIKLLWQHKTEEPIGVLESLREDHYGLWVRGRLLLEVRRAKEAYNLLKNHALKGMSIGFSIVKAKRDPGSRVRFIHQVDLWEISLVTFPANELARVLQVKQQELLEDRYALSALYEFEAAELIKTLRHLCQFLQNH